MHSGMLKMVWKYVFVSQNVNLMLQYWDGEQLQQSDAMLVTELDIAISSID